MYVQEAEPTLVDGNGTETGHIIVTTVAGSNGQPKQVNLQPRKVYVCLFLCFSNVHYDYMQVHLVLDLNLALCLTAHEIILSPSVYLW